MTTREAVGRGTDTVRDRASSDAAVLTAKMTADLANFSGLAQTMTDCERQY